jgi:hypothetical protein
VEQDPTTRPIEFCPKVARVLLFGNRLSVVVASLSLRRQYKQRKDLL